MSKLFLFITIHCVSLCSVGVYAQNLDERVITIEEMFSLADRNSKALHSLSTLMEEAVQSVETAKSSRLPDIEASVSVSFLGNGILLDRDFTSSSKAPMPHFGNNFALEVSQVIYAGGAINSGIEISKLEEKKAVLLLENERDKLRFLLVGYYLDLFRQKNLFCVYERNIDLAKQVLADIKAKNREGVVLGNDITRYELQLTNLELARTRILNSIMILNDNLITVLGLPASVRVEVDTTLLSRPMPLNNCEHWHKQALSHSLSLQQEMLTVEMNKRQERVIRSELLPKIAFFATNRFDGPITIEVPPIDKNFNYWYVGIGVKYNLSSLYKANNSVKRGKLATRRAMQHYDDVKEQTELAVRADYIKYMEAYEQLNTQVKNVELATQNYAVVSNRYKNDMALITDMLDASAAKLSAEQQLINARINIIFQYYKLLYLSGIL
ncbi:TolC family protein [Butyricimonas paravirosa]